MTAVNKQGAQTILGQDIPVPFVLDTTLNYVGLNICRRMKYCSSIRFELRQFLEISNSYHCPHYHLFVDLALSYSVTFKQDARLF